MTGFCLHSSPDCPNSISCANLYQLHQKFSVMLHPTVQLRTQPQLRYGILSRMGPKSWSCPSANSPLKMQPSTPTDTWLYSSGACQRFLYLMPAVSRARGGSFNDTCVAVLTIHACACIHARYCTQARMIPSAMLPRFGRLGIASWEHFIWPNLTAFQRAASTSSAAVKSKLPSTSSEASAEASFQIQR